MAECNLIFCDFLKQSQMLYMLHMFSASPTLRVGMYKQWTGPKDLGIEEQGPRENNDFLINYSLHGNIS